VTVRATEGDAVRVLRGSAVEVHRYENEYIVTWAKSSLELELPSAVALLVARGIGGNVSVYGFAGELRVDALGGSVIVDGPVQPLRISSVGGTVRVTDLGLTSGSSSITVTGGDVHISIAPEASLELRATASFGGGLELPPGSTHTTGRTRHRGTCVFGERSGRLKVDTVAGWIRVRDPYERATGHPDPESWWDEQVNQRDEPTRPERSSDSASPYAEGLERDSVPPPPIPTPPVPTPPTSTPRVPTPPNPAASEGNPPTSPRDVAGEAMGDSGIAAEVFGRTSRRTGTGSGEATNRPDGAELDPHREEERP
jgi:hypothetical protein